VKKLLGRSVFKRTPLLSLSFSLLFLILAFVEFPSTQIRSHCGMCRRRDGVVSIVRPH